MGTIAGALMFAWVVTSLGSAFTRSGERSRCIADAAIIYHRLTLGMDRDQVIRLVGWNGQESQSKDDSGTWNTVRWQDGNKYLRVTFHNDRLVDWALY
jgi:hypothetical protein